MDRGHRERERERQTDDRGEGARGSDGQTEIEDKLRGGERRRVAHEKEKGQRREPQIVSWHCHLLGM